MRQQYVQIENVFFRLFHDVTRYVVEEKDFRSVGETNLNLLKVLHTHPYYETFVTLNRAIEIKTEYKIYTVNPGDILIVPPGVTHAMLPADSETKYNWLCFMFVNKFGGNRDLYHDLHQTYGKKEPVLIKERPHEAEIIYQLSYEADLRPYHTVMIAAILMQLSGLPGGKQPVEAGVSDRISPDDIDVVTACSIENLLASHYMKNITVEEAAHQLFVSPRQLGRLFVKYKGMSFQQAVILRRLRVSAELLETTQLTVEQIGSVVGFPSRVSFTRAFSSKYGVPPGKYRSLYSSNGQDTADK